MVKKTSCKKFRKFALEEERTAKDYKKRGFIKFGREEAKHARFFRRQLKKCRR